MVADQFRDDVPGSGEGGPGIVDVLDRVDERDGGSQGIEPGIREEGVRQRLKSPFPRHHGPGPAFGAERGVKILQTGHGGGREKGSLEVIRQQMPLHEGLEHGFATPFQFLQAGQVVADAGQRDLIERSGGLLAIPGDERDGGSFRQEAGDGAHAVCGEIEFRGGATGEAGRVGDHDQGDRGKGKHRYSSQTFWQVGSNGE